MILAATSAKKASIKKGAHAVTTEVLTKVEGPKQATYFYSTSLDSSPDD